MSKQIENFVFGVIIVVLAFVVSNLGARAITGIATGEGYAHQAEIVAEAKADTAQNKRKAAETALRLLSVSDHAPWAPSYGFDNIDFEDTHADLTSFMLGRFGHVNKLDVLPAYVGARRPGVKIQMTFVEMQP